MNYNRRLATEHIQPDRQIAEAFRRLLADLELQSLLSGVGDAELLHPRELQRDKACAAFARNLITRGIIIQHTEGGGLSLRLNIKDQP